jgi:transposase-like protein
MQLVKLKRLTDKDESSVIIHPPLSDEEIAARVKNYDVLTPKQFGTRYKELLFRPVEFETNGHSYQIQLNHCVNPYCKWYGLPQRKFDTKGKPSRYKLIGSGNDKSLKCNPDPLNKSGAVLGTRTYTISNWSVVEEIKRLKRIETVKDIEPEYKFHKEECSNSDLTPFNEPKAFYKRGKSKSNSQRYQCKECKKFTNVLPNQRQSTTYHQKRNDVLPMFAKLLLNRTPVTRTCEILGIGRGTYYDKLEILYRRCLEFIEKHETRPLKNIEFDEMWLNSDRMIYHLNNVRKKGQGGSQFNGIEELQLPTSVIITSDVFSRYVFRSDVAYDWDITLNDVEQDTRLFKEDHLSEFAKRNARFGEYSYFPQPPSKTDTQSQLEYYHELRKFERREKYIDGLHVHATYTNIAHFWLIKQLVNASEWRFVTDDDKSLINSINRVFSKEIRLTDGHHFLCQTDKTKSRKMAYEEFKQAKQDLLEWGDLNEVGTNSLRKLAYLYLKELFETHTFHKEISDGSGSHNEYAGNPIEHPLASIDRGFRSVDCTTDLSSLEPKEVAKLIVNVNDNATNSFIQHIRRRLSILERPLTTARGDGKSYIYSNFNPKYAQMALTILRTYHNFCLPFKTKEGKKTTVKTPAHRLGITDKEFSLEDIIYLR